MSNIITARQQDIINIIEDNSKASISDISKNLLYKISIPTLNREIATLVEGNYLTKVGKGRATYYILSPAYKILAPIDVSGYFDKEPDQRNVLQSFNFDLFTSLGNIDLFSSKEKELLESLRLEYQSNISTISPTLYQKELERLTIELSWKSSQIEGNTYSLLETERLFMERQLAQGKPEKDAFMLLNHKNALNYLLEHKDIALTLNLKLLEEIHSLLIKDLGVSRNIRSRTVGITGTVYKPLDNIYQIKENLEKMCSLINSKNNGFEKALLALMLISYIQPFEDGNKRTARMVSNALLIAYTACPLSYRSVDSLYYKKAMLLFYEQNKLSVFKKLFIEQNIFSVKNYFR